MNTATFVLLSYFEIQQSNATIQYNSTITACPSSTHTLQFGLDRVAPACREHFRGGVPMQSREGRILQND
jgi:hypothetical protein